MGSRSGLSCDIRLNSHLPEAYRSVFQDPGTITRILEEADTIATYGLSTKSHKASQFVASYLQYEGYRIVPVNPFAEEILGETAYPDLETAAEAVEGEIDVVDVFRPPSEVPGIVDEALEVGAAALWLQLRIVDLEAGERAREEGIDVVMDKCLKMEHGRYSGGLHSMGMNTELITSRRGMRMLERE